MNENERIEFRENILHGMNLAFERLVEQRRKDDDSLILYRNGKVDAVKATEIQITSDIQDKKEES